MKRFFFLPLLLCGVSAHAASPVQVLQQVRAASGGEQWNSIAQVELEATVMMGGLKGSQSESASLRDLRRVTRYDLKVVAGSEGFDGAATWHADDAGLVDVDESEAGRRQSLTESFISSRAYLKPQVAELNPTLKRQENFDVVSITPRGADPVELWIDSRSHLITRVVLPVSREQQQWSDYRSVSGVMLPHRIESTGADNNVQTAIVERYALSHQVDPQRFVRPHTRLHDTEVGKDNRILPAYVQRGHVYVEAAINDAKPGLFILDTGASMNVLTPEGAKQSGVRAEGSFNGNGVGEEQVEVSLASVSKVRVGPALLRNQSFAIVPMPPLHAHRDGREEPALGLLGYNFFRRLRVTIDYDAPAVRLETLQPCGSSPAGAVKLYLDDQRIPRIPLTIEGVEALWNLDVGAFSLTMSSAVARRVGVSETAGIATVTEGGVGGVMKSRLLHFDHLMIGNYRLNAPLIAVSEQKAGVFAGPRFGGNIGSGALRNFVATFDYECRRLELAPSRLFGTPMPTDRLGVTWRRTPNGSLQVLHVMSGSPATAAGIRSGDELIAVNGRAQSDLTHNYLRDLQNQPPGTLIAFKLRRAEQPYEVQVTLAAFIPEFAASSMVPRQF